MISILLVTSPTDLDLCGNHINLYNIKILVNFIHKCDGTNINNAHALCVLSRDVYIVGNTPCELGARP